MSILACWLVDIGLNTEKIDSLINIIISTTSITVAILVTFFFSKLFAERQDRIQRKASIDEYSKKITALRRIAYHIRSDHEFWKFSPKTKSTIDKTHENLTVEMFRSLDYDEYSKLTKELGGELAPQAYLSLKGLENEENSSFEFFRSFKLQNYNLDELARFVEYCGFFWAYLEEYKSDLNFNNSSVPYTNQIKENFIKIKGRAINEEIFLKEIMNLFSEFQEKIIPEMYFLTELNQRRLPNHFVWIAINLVIYIIVMLSSIILFFQPIGQNIKTYLLITLISLFTINTIDLIIGLFMSISKELTIKTFYKI